MKKETKNAQDLKDLEIKLARDIEAILENSINTFCDESDDCEKVHLDVDLILSTEIVNKEINKPTVVRNLPATPRPRYDSLHPRDNARVYNHNFHVLSVDRPRSLTEIFASAARFLFF